MARKRSKSSDLVLRSLGEENENVASSSRRQPEENEDEKMDISQENYVPKWNTEASDSSSSFDSSDDDIESDYELSSNECGICLVFNNTFQNEILFDNNIYLKHRQTSFFDVQRISRLFKWLKFKVKIYQDTTKYEFLSTLKRELLNEESRHFQCFTLFFLTYGQDSGVYSANGKVINIREEIIDLLSSNNCPVFAEKPKLVFFQASRPPLTDTIQFDNISEHRDNPTVNEYFSADSDIFVYSSPNIEKYEWSTGGSTFIQLLCFFFEKYGHVYYLYDLVLKINGKLARVVAQENIGTDDNKMAGIYNLNTLRKKLKFSPRTPFKQANIYNAV